MNRNITKAIQNLRDLKVLFDSLGAEATAFERGLHIGIAIGIESNQTIPAWELLYLKNIRKHWRQGL